MTSEREALTDAQTVALVDQLRIAEKRLIQLEAALIAAGVHLGEPRDLDAQALTDALNVVLKRHPSLTYAGFVYGETGAEVAREYAIEAARLREPTDD